MNSENILSERSQIKEHTVYDSNFMNVQNRQIATENRSVARAWEWGELGCTEFLFEVIKMFLI